MQICGLGFWGSWHRGLISPVFWRPITATATGTTGFGDHNHRNHASAPPWLSSGVFFSFRKLSNRSEWLFSLCGKWRTCFFVQFWLLKRFCVDLPELGACAALRGLAIKLDQMLPKVFFFRKWVQGCCIRLCCPPKLKNRAFYQYLNCECPNLHQSLGDFSERLFTLYWGGINARKFLFVRCRDARTVDLAVQHC